LVEPAPMKDFCGADPVIESELFSPPTMTP